MRSWLALPGPWAGDAWDLAVKEIWMNSVTNVVMTLLVHQPMRNGFSRSEAMESPRRRALERAVGAVLRLSASVRQSSSGRLGRRERAGESSEKRDEAQQKMKGK